MSDNVQSIQDAIENAPAVVPPPEEKETRRRRRKGNAPHDMDWPDDCPVEPLGIAGEYVYLLDEKRQLQIIKSKDLNHSTISAYFHEQPELLYAYWPTWKQDKDENWIVNGWNSIAARDALRKEAARRGIINIANAVRGPGCWLDEDGRLVMHCGNVLFHDGKPLTPRTIGRHVYPADAPRPGPDMEKADTEAAEDLLALLGTWNWRRPDLDPYLMLGWINAAIIGGALDWRPLVWVTGDAATGKSTLHKLIKDVMGPDGAITPTDTTAAGLWQYVGHKSLPIAVDELEAEADNRKAAAIIKMARHAASGGQTLRGGSDHKGSNFTIRSCCMFSSILIPPLLGQDVSRMAVLQLDELTGSMPDLQPRRLNQIGERLRARWMRRWREFPKFLKAWQDYLAKNGHDGRGCAQFGTLMACYDFALSDLPPAAEELDKWTVHLESAKLAESDARRANHERCIAHLLTVPLDTYRHGERRTAGSWIMQAAGMDRDRQSAGDMSEANKVLCSHGLKIMEKEIGGKKFQYLMVANDHQGLAGLFRDTQWRAEDGTDGGWVQAVRRIKNHLVDRQRFDSGKRHSCTAVPLDEIFKDEGGDDAEVFS